jgi:hypothetical protein
VAVYFCDSSAIVKCYVQEQGSAWMVALLDAAAVHHLYLARIIGVQVIQMTGSNPNRWHLYPAASPFHVHPRNPNASRASRMAALSARSAQDPDHKVGRGSGGRECFVGPSSHPESWHGQHIRDEAISRRRGGRTAGHLARRRLVSCPSSLPNSDICGPLLGGTWRRGVERVSVGTVGPWDHTLRRSAGHALAT